MRKLLFLPIIIIGVILALPMIWQQLQLTVFRKYRNVTASPRSP